MKQMDFLTEDLFPEEEVGPRLKPKEFPLPLPDEPIELNFLDEGIDWREYQIAPLLMMENDLNIGFVLPTAKGKTYAASLVCDFKLEEGKVLIMAPTKPLVKQHMELMKNLFNLPSESFLVLTGETKPDKRNELWENDKVKIFFATPQTVLNDINNKRVILDDFSLAIFDECHHARGKEPYAEIGLYCYKKRVQMLGLTASPGGKDRVLSMENFLHLDHWVHISLDDDNLKRFHQPRMRRYVDIPLSSELSVLMELMESLMKRWHQELFSEGFVKEEFKVPRSSEIKRIRRDIGRELKKKEDSPDSEKTHLYSSLKYHAGLAKSLHLYKLLSENYSSSLNYLESLREDNAKAAKEILESPEIREMRAFLDRMRRGNVKHPKLEKVKELVKRELESERKVIIFVRFVYSNRIVAEFLGKSLKEAYPVSLLGSKHMKSDEQQKTLDDFKKGEANVLVSTNVGREGLHIPIADTFLFYSVPRNSTEMIQWVGRVGREKYGRVFFMVLDNPIEKALYFSSTRKEKGIEERSITVTPTLRGKILGLSMRKSLFSGRPRKEEKGFLINLLDESSLVFERFRLDNLKVKSTSKGRFYLKMELSDKTASVDAFYWCQKGKVGKSEARLLSGKLNIGDIIIVSGEIRRPFGPNHHYLKIDINPEDEQFIVKCPEDDYHLSDYKKPS